MEMMVSSSNNIEQVIYLWQKLIWSKQPESLLSTKSLIVISIVIFLIMTLLKEEEKEKEEKHYYNNLSNGCLTILLTIISGIIFGKGLEILFRTLHIFSGAYGNVVFSLKDIFISLLFGCIFVISGYCLLFNKKLRELLRLQKSEDAILKEIMANNKALIVTRLKAMRNYLELKIKMEPEGTVSKLHEIYIKIKETVSKLKKIGFKNHETWNSLNEMESGMNPYVKAELKKEVETTQELFSKLNQKLLNYELNEAGPEEIKTELEAIVAGFQEYNAILTKEKAAKESELKVIMTNDKALIVTRFKAMRDYLKLTMVGKPKETRTKLKNVCIKINEIADSLNEMEAELGPDVKDKLEEKVESIVKLTSELNQKLISSKLNEAGPEEIKTELQAIVAGLDECKEILTEFKTAKESELEAARAATVAELEERNGRNISIVARLKEMVASFFST
ncbi:hypothetical protein GINT2_002079 [Glugoides intestinalis]